MLSDLERQVLRHWQADASLTAAEIGDKIGLSAAQTARRMKRLRDIGVVRAVETEINWAALGYTIEVSLRITLDKSQPRAVDEFLAAARDVPEVTEIQTFLGRVDARLNVIARDLGDYHQVYKTRILTLPHVADIEALLLISRIKAEATYPI